MHLYHFVWTLCLAIIRSCFATEFINKFRNPFSCRIDESGQTICSSTNWLGLKAKGNIGELRTRHQIMKNGPYINEQWILYEIPGKSGFPHAAMQKQDHWWFEEIAESNKCKDLSKKALLISYGAKTTGPLSIQYHQKLDQSCTSVDPTKHTAQIMFYSFKNDKCIPELIVPLTVFVGADLTLGYGFTFHGPLDIYEIGLVDIGETYQAHVPTTDIVHVADHSLPVMSLALSEPEISLLFHEEHEFSFTGIDQPDLNLNGIMFKIVYSSAFTGIRRLSLVQHGKSIPAQILFTKGNHIDTVVLFSFFLGANPSIGISKLILRGPLTVHRLELVYVPTSQRIMPLPFTQSLHLSDSSHNVSLDNQSTMQPSRPNYLISQDRVLDDFLNQISPKKDLRMQISVTFKDNAESNFCEKNVRLFYTHLSHNLSRPAGFLPSADKTLNIYPIIFNKGVSEQVAIEEVDEYLESIGRFVGSSILHGHLLDLTFSPEIYNILQVIYPNEVSMKICSFQFPNLVNGHRMYTTGPCNPRMLHHEKMQLMNQVQRNLGVFHKGVHRIVPYWYLEEMKLVDLKNLMHGKSDFDLQDWKTHTILDGYEQEDITIQLFWKVMTEWDEVLQSKLLYFVTGSPRVAYVGFKRLNGGLFTIRKTEAVVPSSDKCGNILNLPAYVDLKTMKNKLEDALKDALATAVQNDFTK